MARGCLIVAASVLAVGLAASAGAAGKAAHAAAENLEQLGPDGSTPLQWAVYKGDAAAVKRLLAAGAKVS